MEKHPQGKQKSLLLQSQWEIKATDRLEGHFPQAITECVNRMKASLTPNNIEGIAVSSTVGYTDELRHAIGEENVIYLDASTPIPIRNCYATPNTLGPDRLAAAIGAHSLCPTTNVLIIDMGTAITYDYIDANHRYIGGNISPGVEMRLKALHDYTARLPMVNQNGEYTAIGTSTETAIRAGVMIGVKHEVEGYIRAFITKNNNVSVFLTGGNALNFDDLYKTRIFAHKFLVQEGLAEVFDYNKHK